MDYLSGQHISYIAEEVKKSSHLISIPIVAVIILIAYYFNKKTKVVKPHINIQELQEKLRAFKPEPLIPPNQELFNEDRVPSNFSKSEFNTVQNLALTDFLNISQDEKVKEIASNCIKSNGVGSCGPRGFYGTVDVHLDLECKIAEFMGLEEAVLYSYSVSTMSSAIIAYCKKGDAIFCDEKVYYPSIQGAEATKATLIYFKHNDTADLEQKLIEFNYKEANKKRKARKFLLVEGIYHNTGTLCPLPELMRLREKYMMRMFLDECISFGAIGKYGRGVTEHYDVDRTDIDLIVGSLEYGVGSIGGFCVGSSFIIEHQRLSGLGYCFSASLPPFLSSIAKYTIESFESRPEAFEKLKEIAIQYHNELIKIDKISVLSDDLSPKKVFITKDNERVKSECLSRGVIINIYENTMYFNVHLAMTPEYISKVCGVIRDAVFLSNE